MWENGYIFVVISFLPIILNLMEMTESSPNGFKKKLWEKEKLLITNNFSISNSVFKRLVPHTRKKQGMFWETVKLP